jgi:hypothetical protein
MFGIFSNTLGVEVNIALIFKKVNNFLETSISHSVFWRVAQFYLWVFVDIALKIELLFSII